MPQHYTHKAVNLMSSYKEVDRGTKLLPVNREIHSLAPHPHKYDGAVGSMGKSMDPNIELRTNKVLLHQDKDSFRCLVFENTMPH